MFTKDHTIYKPSWETYLPNAEAIIKRDIKNPLEQKVLLDLIRMGMKMPKDKKEVKKEVKKVKSSGKYKITKPNGNVIYRTGLGDYVKVYESKGCKVEEV